MSEVKAGKMHDMTVGSPVKLILHFMVPVFLGNVFQQFYNVADSIIAGQFLGVRALAAIGSTGSLMFFVTGWLNGLTSGFAILVAQWFGAKEYERMRHYVAMSVYLSLGFAVLMTIGLGLANVPILRLMNYSDEIMPDVKAYMGIIYAGLVVTAAYNALAAFLRALGDSKSPLYFLIISAAINVALDIAFIIYGGMGRGGLCLRNGHRPGDISGAVFYLHCEKVSDFTFEKGKFLHFPWSPAADCCPLVSPWHCSFPSRPLAPSSCRVRSMCTARTIWRAFPQPESSRISLPQYMWPSERPLPLMWDKTGEQARRNACLWA